VITTPVDSTTPGHLDRLVDVGLRPDEAARLHHAFERFDIDLVDLQGVVVVDRRFHLRGDHAVIDVLTGSLLRGRRRAPPSRRHHDGKDQHSDPSQESHDQTSIHTTITVRIERRSPRRGGDADQVEYEVEFARAGDPLILDRFPMHLRCFAMREFERMKFPR
jgi:hypothetical protein